MPPRTIKSHQTYVNLTDAFFKQLSGVVKRALARGAASLCITRRGTWRTGDYRALRRASEPYQRPFMWNIAASYRQEPQRQGERRYCDHKAHKSQLDVVARCQMGRRLPNWYAI